MGQVLETSGASRTQGEIALIHAAERLFAEHGIAGVSLRSINQAANHKNISAAHYHFGSREGLIEAVLEYRVIDLDNRRKEWLARSEAGQGLPFYVEALVSTLAEELKPRPEGNHYLQFVQQYERYKGAQVHARTMSPAGLEIYQRIEECISYLPKPVRRLRLRYLVNIVHGVLATAEREIGNGALDADDVELIAADLTSMVTAAISAPLSTTTLGLLAYQR
ncbi:TetR/AcrR family transcriptional regulator [Novosphingobium malaysiense]|uniref:TetR/AcrR family transcriptional regulator n=1 Tax=Novosphingobium malaysiense TaxID=1348853 RepID=UPI00068E25C5|nr:TetR/AcrR family transcriptional regulator [Novosphingobium malaysiense]